MKRRRSHYWAALAILPAVLGSTRGAVAAPSSSAAPGRGVHLGADGHYYEDVCDRATRRHCFLQRRIQPMANAPSAGSMAPPDVLAAYQIPASSSAGGKIVALVDMADSSAYADLATYRQQFGLPALPKCSGLPDGKTACFAQVDENGTPSATTDAGTAFDMETSLDMDMVSAACPDCAILLVQMTNASPQTGPSDQDFITSVATAAKLGAVASSISFGGPEQGGDPKGFTTPGHLVVAASGDTGYLLQGTQGGGKTPSWPASAPDVLGIGGTLLQHSGGAYSEIVWNDANGAGGSGCSTEYPMPAYQTAFGASHFGPCAQRASVDVSAAADFVSGQGGGIAEYDPSGWNTVVGTSAASPIAAAVFARMGVAEAFANDFGAVYGNASGFNDVTSGTNDSTGKCQDVTCTAGPGWDGPTGVGTPNGTKLQALASGSGSGGGADGGADAMPGGGSKGGASMPDAGAGDAGGSEPIGSSSGPSGASSSGGAGDGTGTAGAGAPSGGSWANDDTDLNKPANGLQCSAMRGVPASGYGAGAALGLGLLAALALRRRRARDAR